MSYAIIAWACTWLVHSGMPANHVSGALGPIVVVSDGSSESQGLARRLSAELKLAKHRTRLAICATAKSPGRGDESPKELLACVDFQATDNWIVIRGRTDQVVSTWVGRQDHQVGPLSLRLGDSNGGRATADFVAEIVGWAEGIEIPLDSPSRRVVPSPVALPDAAPPQVASKGTPTLPSQWLWNLGASALFIHSTSGLRGRGGPELSVGMQRPFGSRGLLVGVRVGAWVPVFSQSVSVQNVDATVKPQIVWFQGTTATTFVHWIAEGHVAAGPQRLLFEAVTPTARSSRTDWGIALGAGARLAWRSGETAFGRWELGIDLRLVSSFQQPVVSIGTTRFGDSDAPSIAAGLALRWER